MKDSFARKVFNVWNISFFVLMMIVVLFPYGNVLAKALNEGKDTSMGGILLLPRVFTWENFKTVILDEAFGQALFISVSLVITNTVFHLLVQFMAAYTFLHKDLVGHKALMLFLLIPMYFGGGLVPTYLNLKNLHLINTHTGVIMLTLVSVSHIIIIMKGFEAVPRELEEAAKIDGAQDFQVFFRVMLPMNKPTLATYSLFTFVDLWNGWYWPMLILTDSDKSLLQVFLRNIVNAAGKMSGMSDGGSMGSFSMGIQMACILVVIVPVMLIYPYVQRYFVKGIYVGSVKM